jgi:hypothetical protein
MTSASGTSERIVGRGHPKSVEWIAATRFCVRSDSEFSTGNRRLGNQTALFKSVSPISFSGLTLPELLDRVGNGYNADPELWIHLHAVS